MIPKNPDLPQTDVSYNEAVAYCAWAGPGGRLPTKAEWEYAAHGGKPNAEYPTGDDIGKDQARWDNKASVLRVKSYAPNGYGLYDMAGNAAEFVQNRLVKGGHHLSVNKGDLKISKDYLASGSGSNENNGFRCVIP